MKKFHIPRLIKSPKVIVLSLLVVVVSLAGAHSVQLHAKKTYFTIKPDMSDQTEADKNAPPQPQKAPAVNAETSDSTASTTESATTNSDNSIPAPDNAVSPDTDTQATAPADTTDNDTPPAPTPPQPPTASLPTKTVTGLGSL